MLAVLIPDSLATHSFPSQLFRPRPGFAPIVFALLLISPRVFSQVTVSNNDITAKTGGMRKIDGYVPLYWDDAAGRLLMEISRFNQEFLYQVSLPAGVGSNPLGVLHLGH